MKISKNFKLKNIAGSFAVIPVGNNVVDFSSMITTNEVGAFLINSVQSMTLTAKPQLRILANMLKN